MALRLGSLQDALLDTKVSVLTWMVATVIALALGNLFLSFNILSRLPR